MAWRRVDIFAFVVCGIANKIYSIVLTLIDNNRVDYFGSTV